MEHDDVPVLRVTSMSHALQVDASVVPAGPLRVAVVDQDERRQDLLIRLDGGDRVLLRVAPGSTTKGRELTTYVEAGEYVVVAEHREGESELRAPFTAQEAPDNPDATNS